MVDEEYSELDEKLWHPPYLFLYSGGAGPQRELRTSLLPVVPPDADASP